MQAIANPKAGSDLVAEESPGADALSAYLWDISHVDLLTPEQEWALGEAIQRGEEALDRLRQDVGSAEEQTPYWQWVLEGRQAARQLAEANLRLVVSVAKRYARSGVPLADLIQEGNLGLLRAVQKYDYRMRLRFSTYAVCWIRQAIRRSIQERGRAIRLPAHMAETVSVLRAASQRLEQQLGRDATAEELACEIGDFDDKERDRIHASIDVGVKLEPKLAIRFAKARAKVKLALDSMVEPISIESPVGKDQSGSLADVIPNKQSVGPDDQAFAQILKEHLSTTIRDLSEREQLIVRCRFGLDDGAVMTLEEIGQHLGVTRERVRQLQNRALRKLRDSAQGLELAVYLT